MSPEQLRQQIQDGRNIKENFAISEFRKWKDLTLILLEKNYGAKNRLVQEFGDIGEVSVIGFGDNLEELEDKEAQNEIGRGIEILEVFERLESDPIEARALEKQAGKLTPEVISSLHPLVVSAAQNAFEKKMYRNAVHDAFIGALDYLKKKSGYPKQPSGQEKDGDSLVRYSFGGERPIFYYVNNPQQAEKDFQCGVLNLWLSIVNFRNEKAHKLTEIDSIEKAVAYLNLASLALIHLDEAKKRKSVTERKTATAEA
ncbi:MAG: hypothetical protein JWO96_839 [Candidatus Saccharibacteria bacterium]|nr:hypothetical protein [Candidatus Saccharibacteria bacterium]